jgi:hypothetical protein
MGSGFSIYLGTFLWGIFLFLGAWARVLRGINMYEKSKQGQGCGRVGEVTMLARARDYTVILYNAAV